MEEIFFCENCGKRITELEIQAGRCRREGTEAWCPPCTLKLKSGSTNPRPLPGSGSRAPTISEPAATPNRAPTRQLRRTPAPGMPLRGGTPRGGLQTMSRKDGRTESASRASVVQYSKRNLIAAASVGAFSLMFVVWFAASRSNHDPKETSNAKGPVAPAKAEHPIDQKTQLREPDLSAKARVNLDRDLVGLYKVSPTLPRLTVPRPGAELTIDGHLDEAAWKFAPAQQLFFMNGQHTAPSGKTTFRLLATETTLYIGARLEEDELAQIPVPVRKPDTEAWSDDNIELFMLPGTDSSGVYYQWIVTLAGSIWDGRSEGNHTKTNPGSWSPQGIRFAVATAPEQKYWSVEVAIPLSQIPGADEHAFWRFNLFRNRPKHDTTKHPKESTSWAVLESDSTHVPERFGVIALQAFGGKIP